MGRKIKGLGRNLQGVNNKFKGVNGQGRKGKIEIRIQNTDPPSFRAQCSKEKDRNFRKEKLR